MSLEYIYALNLALQVQLFTMQYYQYQKYKYMHLRKQKLGQRIHDVISVKKSRPVYCCLLYILCIWALNLEFRASRAAELELSGLVLLEIL